MDLRSGETSSGDVVIAGRPVRTVAPRPFTIGEAEDSAGLAAHRALRHRAFVEEQRLFATHDVDPADEDPRTRVLVARVPDGTVVGGVRVHPALPGPDLGWWRGSRLVVVPGRGTAGVAAALVTAACALAETLGALRFDATVQARNERLFRRLGWSARQAVELHGRPHLLMEWPVGRVQRLVDATKAPLGPLLRELGRHPAAGGGPGFRGDDGAPVPGTAAGSGMVAACDAILPSMVERDPEWAGWCAVLVNLNDLFAMGARPVGLLDAVGARDASFARRILRGLAEAADAWDVPVLGGHTQLGVPAALSVTALGRTDAPVRGGGGRAGERVRVTADLSGAWRPAYRGTQWDSSSTRSPAQLRRLADVVPALAPTAAKDVSMSGLVGTLGMLAEAGGCGAVLDVADVPTPAGAGTAEWLTCFPGFAVVSTEPAGHRPDPLPDLVTSARCGELVPGNGVELRWPDGLTTRAVASTVTGMGAA
ncbi:AIR synthase [Phycicoccus sp. CSK15P-2]|uniref:MSMEG_0567/sll0787 family protein n=1 Tax=Phycicoccus sp. CSK15P-2 TaxID=2807627 RepID=UPI00194EA0D4|nr:MSMEG_0567/sll0787 family protein [Phycicoccus sp. CSK15P-2]MBM6402977.1 AIR synthase [Phycicoccus sp. CSK15P-2]